MRRCTGVKVAGVLVGVLASLGVNRRGVITVMLALMLPVMIGFIGLGVEAGMWFQNKRDIQTAADAAAAAATLNGYVAGSDTLTAVNPPSTGSNTGDGEAVEVNISSSVNLIFANMFLDNAITIAARAVATTTTGGEEACVQAFDASTQRANNVTGSAVVDMEGCEVATNSAANNSISVSHNGTLGVDCIATVGNVNGTVAMDECNDAKTGVSSITDPYSEVTTAELETYADTALGNSGMQISGASFTVTLMVSGTVTYIQVTDSYSFSSLVPLVPFPDVTLSVKSRLPRST